MDNTGIKTLLSTFTAVLLCLASLVSLTGCDRCALDIDGIENGNGVARAELKIQLDVDGGAMVGDVETKSVVTGTTLAESERTYGIIACEHESGTPTQFKTYDADDAGLYGNIKAYYYNMFGSKGWNYSYESSSTSYFRPLYFVTNNPSRHMDIYAYAPWKSGVTIQSGYYYYLSSLTESSIPDLMYATYLDAHGDTTNRDVAIVDGSTIPLSIKFHHALSRIVFHFKLANAQNIGLDGEHAIRLYQIDLVKADTSSTPLYTQGKMELLNGNVSRIGQSQLLQTVIYAQDKSDNYKRYDISQANSWVVTNMLVHPENYQFSGDFSFRFFFNGTEQNQALVNQYIIQKNDLKHPNTDPATGQNIYGFKPGYCYHFYFIIDNYIHLQNVVINTDWELTDEEPIKI